MHQQQPAGSVSWRDLTRGSPETNSGHHASGISAAVLYASDIYNVFAILRDNAGRATHAGFEMAWSAILGRAEL